MKRIRGSDAARLQQLEQRLGSLQVRTILTGENKRLIRPERLDNLTRGTGKLSGDEAAMLKRLSASASKIQNFRTKQTTDERKGYKRKDYKVNRAARDWLKYGKAKGGDKRTPDEEQKAMRALRFLGIDPSEKTYYVAKGSA